MCGIFGVSGHRCTSDQLLAGLGFLEYRGYDSSGIAVVGLNGLHLRRRAGPLSRLVEAVTTKPCEGNVGIGHTRWATHGLADETNAHPHVCGQVAIVHNGIVENHAALRRELQAAGAVFASQTDSEVLAHLVWRRMADGTRPCDAVERVMTEAKGSFAAAFVFEDEEDLIVATRRAAPLIVGFGSAREVYVASDTSALAPFAVSAVGFEDDGLAIIRDGGVHLTTGGSPRKGHRVRLPAKVEEASPKPFRHYMAKEIAEQPFVIARAMGQHLDRGMGRARMPEGMGIDFGLLDRLTLVGCGTAHVACLIARDWFERHAGIMTLVETASEFRYAGTPRPSCGLVVAVSQSGETADTLAALKKASTEGQRTVAVVNVTGSAMARASDVVVPVMAGVEIGVASTKAFTCQLVALAALALSFGRARGFLSADAEAELVDKLAEVPEAMARTLALEPKVAKVARRVAESHDVLFIGRGPMHPLALEAALKVTETSYLHAQGFAAGELKHGPLALVDENVCVVVLASGNGIVAKTLSNLHEVAARRGRIVFVGDEATSEEVAHHCAEIVALPEMDDAFRVIACAIVVQMLAYHVAIAKGLDPDRPRNLAKCVTVE